MIATTTQVKNKIKSRKNTALVYIKKQTNKKTQLIVRKGGTVPKLEYINP